MTGSMNKVIAVCQRYLNEPHVPHEVRQGKSAYVYLYGQGHTLFQTFDETNDHASLQGARECFEAAVISFNHDGNPIMATFYDMILMELGAVVAQLGEYETAINILSHCLRLSRQDNYKGGICGALNNLGMVYAIQGDYGKARDSYREVLNTYSSDKEDLTGDEDNLAKTQWNLGRLELSMNNPQEALPLLESAYQTFNRRGLRQLSRQAESDLRTAQSRLKSHRK